MLREARRAVVKQSRCRRPPMSPCRSPPSPLARPPPRLPLVQFAQKMMRTKKVKVDVKLNKAVWSQVRRGC